MMHPREAEADELGSLVEKKANKPGMWIAMDAKTRQMIAFHVGDRRRKRAEALWAKMLEVDQQHATCHPDPYEV